ncbi:ATP-binding protein [Kitasatospora sp. NBC_01560]|uniref:ATP-binding protein n=1 Tax=Kitasatospora sp. NBC_01560 TaxID=2975965 RepID=UPI00386F2370
MTTATTPTRSPRSPHAPRPARSAGPVHPAESTTLLFSHDPDQLPHLRSVARAFLGQARPCSRGHLADVLLVVTELATNVIRHTDGPGRISLTVRPEGTEVAVSDASRALPVPRPLMPGATGGMGLVLVAAVSATLHVTLDPGSGKTVHARLVDRAAEHRPGPGPGPDGRERGW